MPQVSRGLGAILFLCLSPLTALAQVSQEASVPRLINITGVFRPADGRPPAAVETVTLAIYGDETGGAPLWQETQYVVVDADGRYAVLLGATQPDGLPLDLFASGDARWLGRRFERAGEHEQARVLLASVPYALKAADADTLGGRPSSAYLLADPGRVAVPVPPVQRDERQHGRPAHHRRADPADAGGRHGEHCGEVHDRHRPG